MFSLDVINILIGAFIGFVFSTVSTLLSNRFQLDRDKKAREWELFVKAQDHKQEIMQKRIDQIEQYANSMYLISQNIISLEIEAVTRKDNSLITKKVQEFEATMEEFAERPSINLILNDEKLNQAISELSKLNEEGLQYVSKMVMVHDAPHDLSTEMDYINKYSRLVRKSHTAILTILDKLSIR